jgi:hypothetical protein
MDESVEFHLEALNDWLDRNKRLTRRSGVAFEAFILLLAAAFVIVFGPKLLAGSITSIQEGGLAVVLVGACALSYQFVGELGLHRPGGRSLKLSEAGLEVRFAGGQTATFLWDDGSTTFEIFRYQNYSPSAAIPTPYYFKKDTVVTALSEQAYTAVLREVTNRGLVVSTVDGRPWYMLSFGRPLVTSVRGRAPRVIPGAGVRPT